MHKTQDLIQIFNGCFAGTYNTRLIRGEDEPIYLPASADCDYHQVVFAHDFFASGLHEIAHWLVAGEKRRQQEDYGYWYVPDGRNVQQQQAFEQVEVKPQAVEWILSVAAGHRFRVSLDNLGGAVIEEKQRIEFQRNIYVQVQRYLEKPLPKRMGIMVQALLNYYHPGKSLNLKGFQWTGA